MVPACRYQRQPRFRASRIRPTRYSLHWSSRSVLRCELPSTSLASSQVLRWLPCTVFPGPWFAAGRHRTARKWGLRHALVVTRFAAQIFSADAFISTLWEGRECPFLPGGIVELARAGSLDSPSAFDLRRGGQRGGIPLANSRALDRDALVSRKDHLFDSLDLSGGGDLRQVFCPPHGWYRYALL